MVEGQCPPSIFFSLESLLRFLFPIYIVTPKRQLFPSSSRGLNWEVEDILRVGLEQVSSGATMRRDGNTAWKKAAGSVSRRQSRCPLRRRGEARGRGSYHIRRREGKRRRRSSALRGNRLIPGREEETRPRITNPSGSTTNMSFKILFKFL